MDVQIKKNQVIRNQYKAKGKLPQEMINSSDKDLDKLSKGMLIYLSTI
jgi:hypothetical protein